jgi:hypothetical protein
MEMNPYQSPREHVPSSERMTASPTVPRWKITAYALGLILCMGSVVYAILMIGTLGWMSAAAPSAERLETIQCGVGFTCFGDLITAVVMLLIGLGENSDLVICGRRLSMILESH